MTKIKIKPRDSGGSKKSSKTTQPSQPGKQLSLLAKQRSSPTPAKRGSGGTSPLAKIKAGKSSSRPALKVAAKGSGGSTKHKESPDHEYRTIDGVRARVLNRVPTGIECRDFIVEDNGDGTLDVTCPMDNCGESFTVGREWLKGMLYEIHDNGFPPIQTDRAFIYNTGSCPWCGRSSYRYPEGEGLSDDDF